MTSFHPEEMTLEKSKSKALYTTNCIIKKEGLKKSLWKLKGQVL